MLFDLQLQIWKIPKIIWYMWIFSSRFYSRLSLLILNLDIYWLKFKKVINERHLKVASISSVEPQVMFRWEPIWLWDMRSNPSHSCKSLIYIHHHSLILPTSSSPTFIFFTFWPSPPATSNRHHWPQEVKKHQSQQEITEFS